MEQPQGSTGASESKEAIQTVQVIERRERLPLGDRLAWFDDLIGGLLPGGIYLLHAGPGNRKSGLVGQITLALGAAGLQSVCVLTEESESRYFSRAAHLTSDWSADEAKRAMSLAKCDTRVSALEQLPGFFLREVINPQGRYAG